MNERFHAMVLGTIFALAVGWVLYIGKNVFVPIVISVLVVYVIVGMTRLIYHLPLVRRVLPLQLGYTLSALIIAFGLAYIASLAATSLGQVVALAPSYEESLLNAVQEVAAKLGFDAAPAWAALRQELLAEIGSQRFIGSTVISVTAIASSLVIVLLYIVFLLFEQHAFSDKIGKLSDDPRRVANLRRIVANINSRIETYLALKTVVSVAQGLISFAILAFFGVEFAAFWGAVIGLLNYVPYVGSVLGVGLPVAFATMQFADPGIALALLLALSATQFVIGFVVDPYLMGNSLNLSPFVILVSLAVWAGLWGMAGAFLAVPITACIVLMFAEFPGTRGIAILLSRNGQL